MNIYEAPILEISELNSADIITVSTGDTPFGDYEW